MAEYFVALLNGLQSTNNEERVHAESTYDGIIPKERLELLLQILSLQTTPHDTRSLAAVLLRRIFMNQYEQSFEELSSEQQAAVKMQLLQCIISETGDQVRRKIADAAAEMARNQYDTEGNQTWPEYTAFIIQAINEGSQGMPEIALHMFAAVPSAFSDEHTPERLNMIKSLLGKCITAGSSLQLRTAAAKATAAFVVANEDEPSVLSGLRDLLPGLLQSIADSILNEDDTLLKMLVEIAESAHRFLRPQLEHVIALCMTLISNQQLAETSRHLALEVVVTLSEQAAASVRKHGRFIGELVPLILAMMTDLDEEEDWSVQDQIDEDDETSNAITGETALDRLACGLGGKTMLPHILATLPKMLQAPDWKTRHAALMAVSACGEGCHRQMEGMLSDILDAILPFLGDVHPRVRYAACNALGQMSTDFGPGLQKKFHTKVMPGLLGVLDDFPNPRVQAHAGAALVNFSESCPKAIMAMYLDSLMGKLEQILSAKFTELVERGSKLVLEQVVTTIASVADSAEEAFVNYYDRFMPCLKYIMENAVQPELRMLRGKTIECISLIGLAVGKDKFLPDAAGIMQLLVKTQQSDHEMEDDDPQMSYMISGWARMCKIMGPAFEPYLPTVMPMVLKAAQIKPDVCVMDNEEVESIEQDPEWQFIRLGDEQNFAIRTAGLEDKATACQMLVCYARELKTSFAPWVEEVTKIMLPLLKFYFHDEVRSAAAESLPYLLDCAEVNGHEYVAQMWRVICPELIKAIETEPEADVLADDLYALSQCIERIGINCFTNDEFEKVVKEINRLLTEHFEKAEKRLAKRGEEDHDDVEEERLHEEGEDDTYVLAKIADVVHSLFGTHKVALLPFFQQLLPQFVRLLGDDRPWQDWQWGLCIFDDVIERASVAAVQYKEVFLPRLMQCIVHPEPDCRQAAIFGLGIMAQQGHVEYIPALQQGAQLLIHQLIAAPDARSIDNIQATENAISSVTKMMKYSPTVCDVVGGVESLLPIWFSWLPIHEDLEETEHVYGYLCELVERNHPVVINDIPHLVAILAETFRKDGLQKDGQIYPRCINIIRQIQTNQEMFMQCILKLTEEQKMALSKSLEASI